MTYWVTRGVAICGNNSVACSSSQVVHQNTVHEICIFFTKSNKVICILGFTVYIMPLCHDGDLFGSHALGCHVLVAGEFRASTRV